MKTYIQKRREHEKKLLRVKIIIIATAVILAHSAIAQSNTIELTPDTTLSVSDEVPDSPPAEYDPTGLAGVTKVEEKATVAKKETVKPKAVNYNIPGKEDIIRIITEKAIEYGIDVNTALRIARCESGYDTQAKNKHSTATGTWQFTEGTFLDGIKKRGLTWTLEDRKDIYKSTDMAMWYMARGEFERWECY